MRLCTDGLENRTHRSVFLLELIYVAVRPDVLFFRGILSHTEVDKQVCASAHAR